MNASLNAPALPALVDAAEREAEAYAALLRLATRQRRYMVRRDARRLTAVAAAIAEHVEQARATTAHRTRCLADVASQLGVRPEALELQSLAGLADNKLRGRLEVALRRLADVAGLLYRRNFQNHQLARFSLDLVAQEKAVLVGAELPPDDYERSGETRRVDLRGAVDGRA